LDERDQKAMNGCDLLSNFIFVLVLSIQKQLNIISSGCDLLSNFIFVLVLSIEDGGEKGGMKL